MADKILLILDKDSVEIIKSALEFTCDNLSEAHKNVVRSVRADTAKSLWDDAMAYISVKEQLSKPPVTGEKAEADLAVALMDMMAAEGGEPGDSLAQQQAWKRAVQVLKKHGYE